MEYSNVFVCLMGMGTVFFGLICLIVLTSLLGWICTRLQKDVPVSSIPAGAESSLNEAALAAITAVFAEELGTPSDGIRILSLKKL